MKTAILQCLQQFSRKNSKIVYDDQFLKKVKLECLCKIVQNVRFKILNNTLYENCYCAVFAAVFQ